MSYTYKIEQAIRAAAVLHRDQVRKGVMPIPVITHLVSVAMIISDYTDEEDIIVAALLHDTLEDTDYTATELQEDFGGPVRDIVESLTEPQKDSTGAKVAWLNQKSTYAKQLKRASEPALMICAADKIHNMRTIVEDYYEEHVRFMTDFGGNLDTRIEVYQGIADILNERLKSEILVEFNNVFSEYKNFILDVKETKASL